MKSSFVKPTYGSSCFADLPATVAYWLTGQGQPVLERDALGSFTRRHETVIFFFVDAFGWRFFEQYQAHPALHRMVANGHSWKLTSQFPSTTAAHVTTMHTGLPVGQSGIHEWLYYEPKLDSDLFMYVHPGRLEEAQAFLADRLQGQADVVLVSDLIAQGYFGPLPLSYEFISRVGNLVCLPYAGESVFWYEKGKFEQHFYGHHGGLTPQEMQIPLILYDFAG